MLYPRKTYDNLDVACHGTRGHWIDDESNVMAYWRSLVNNTFVIMPFNRNSCFNTKLTQGLRNPHFLFTIRPELRQDYPPNLSILISGGKETNKDSPSNGE